MKIFQCAAGGLFGLIAVFWLPHESRAQGAVEFGKNFSIPVACGCTDKDKADLEQRIKRVEAAMKEYDALIKEWEQREKGAKEPLLLDETSRESVQSSVWFKMKNITVPNAADYSAVTDANCKVKINPSASACLRGALEDHEAVHKHECEKNKDKHLIDWRFTQRVVDYMKEEKAGYQKELERLKSELKKMPAFCSLDKSLRRALQELAAAQEKQKESLKDVETFVSTPTAGATPGK